MNENSYRLKFRYMAELAEQSRIIAEAWKLNQDTIKFRLNANNIPYKILLDDIIMVDMAYHNASEISVPHVLGDRSIFHACLEVLGVKIQYDESNP